MPSRIKKTYSSPEYEARKLAYTKLPLLKVQHPLRHLVTHCYDVVRSLVPRSDDVHSIELAHSTFKRMTKPLVAIAKAGNGGALQRIAMRKVA